jgi:hypothetical protein
VAIAAGTQRHIADRVPRLDRRRRRRTAAEPGEKISRIVGVDGRAADKAEPLAQREQTSVDLDVGETGRAKLELVDGPGRAVGTQFGADALHHAAADRHRVDLQRKLHRP